MNKKILGGAVLLLAGFGVVLVGCQATRSGYESAPYQVVRKAGKIEVRDYPALRVVETTMAPVGEGSDRSFSKLFRYITGGNAASEKIAMTTPVFMNGGNSSNATMAFVLPAKLAADKVPQPVDGSLRVHEIAAGRFAVLRFRGGRNAANEASSRGQLESWLEAEKLPALAGPMFGYFDPPWTPPFLRRNEVMIRIAPGQP